tara:strand:- start:185 stop:577 length:393 start_codon:yes stop_codon:yes gene_type:complete
MVELLLSLAPIDYQHLSRVISVEAARGTRDEYCVAASVLNRVMSPQYPNTVKAVVDSPGQYEGIRSDTPVNLELTEHLQSIEGQTNIIRAYYIIEDRTDFKGQSMLKYRVVNEDPMCDPKGNFFHYNHQT